MNDYLVIGASSISKRASRMGHWRISNKTMIASINYRKRDLRMLPEKLRYRITAP
jgi:hypothetical protein